MTIKQAVAIAAVALTAGVIGQAPWAPEPSPPTEAVPRADGPADLTQHRPPAPTATTTTDSTTSSTTATFEEAPRGEGWLPLLVAHFGRHAPDALAVLRCESSGDPDATNPSSGAAGLFQHLPRYWARRSDAAGLPGADIYDPAANIAVAAWLSRGGTDWSHWTCKP